jgi:hypothetical protein
MTDLFSGHGMPRKLTPIYKRVSGVSFYLSPIVLYDQDIITNGPTSNWASVRFVHSDSTLWKRNDAGALITIDTLPLQWHEIRPLPIIEPPEGPGTWWYIRWIEPEGPDNFDLQASDENEWVIMNTVRMYRFNDPPFGVIRENAVRFEIAVFEAGPTFVKLYASARIMLRYDNT